MTYWYKDETGTKVLSAYPKEPSKFIKLTILETTPQGDLLEVVSLILKSRIGFVSKSPETGMTYLEYNDPVEGSPVIMNVKEDLDYLGDNL